MYELPLAKPGETPEDRLMRYLIRDLGTELFIEDAEGRTTHVSELADAVGHMFREGYGEMLDRIEATIGDSKSKLAAAIRDILDTENN